MQITNIYFTELSTQESYPNGADDFFSSSIDTIFILHEILVILVTLPPSIFPEEFSNNSNLEPPAKTNSNGVLYMKERNTHNLHLPQNSLYVRFH